MRTINTTDILSILNTINNGSFVGITSITEPKMRKTGNPFAHRKVEKMTTQILQYGYNYANGVNNRIDSDKEFVAEPLKWGEWLIPNKVITHKGNLYARFYKVDNDACKASTMWMIDGIIATDEEEKVIKEYLVESSYSARQAEVGLTEHQVKPRDYKFSSIRGISVNGECYEVKAVEVATANA